MYSQTPTFDISIEYEYLDSYLDRQQKSNNYYKSSQQQRQLKRTTRFNTTVPIPTTMFLSNSEENIRKFHDIVLKNFPHNQQKNLKAPNEARVEKIIKKLFVSFPHHHSTENESSNHQLLTLEKYLGSTLRESHCLDKMDFSLPYGYSVRDKNEKEAQKNAKIKKKKKQQQEQQPKELLSPAQAKREAQLKRTVEETERKPTTVFNRFYYLQPQLYAVIEDDYSRSYFPANRKNSGPEMVNINQQQPHSSFSPLDMDQFRQREENIENIRSQLGLLSLARPQGLGSCFNENNNNASSSHQHSSASQVLLTPPSSYLLEQEELKRKMRRVNFRSDDDENETDHYCQSQSKEEWNSMYRRYFWQQNEDNNHRRQQQQQQQQQQPLASMDSSSTSTAMNNSRPFHQVPFGMVRSGVKFDLTSQGSDRFL